ncbi:MAG: CoA-acylating methylmalonate-semialdehyde dehydrogenase, partial [Burkholderiaceae bacterium]
MGKSEAGLADITHWIAGKHAAADASRTGDVFNPATGDVTGLVRYADAATVDQAVSAARDAFSAWSETSAQNRARVMFRFKELLERNLDALATIITQQHGKVLSDAKGEVQRGIEVVEFACGAPQLLKTQYSDNIGGAIDNFSLRQPLGVVAGITPFNFPAMVPMWMFPLALVTGNTFILKPSERDPSASLLLAELLQQAGLPDGAFNVVQGDKVAVDAILQHRDIAAVSFVGSTAVAQYIHAEGTRHGKRVQALGGAKNHMVVMPDADLDVAADALIGAAYGSAGERCMAISVCVAVGDVADPLIEKLQARIERLRIDDGMQPDADIGPVVTAAHKQKIESYIDDGIACGARIVSDGRALSVV